MRKGEKMMPDEKYYALSELKKISRLKGNQWTGPERVCDFYDIEKLPPADVIPALRSEWDDAQPEHAAVCKELTELYARKNHDYGDSFHTTFQKWGLTMAAIRLEDKLRRFETLIRSDNQVKDESIRDTLIDLCNYGIMTVMELDRGKAND